MKEQPIYLHPNSIGFFFLKHYSRTHWRGSHSSMRQDASGRLVQHMEESCCSNKIPTGFVSAFVNHNTQASRPNDSDNICNKYTNRQGFFFLLGFTKHIQISCGQFPLN
ncbi:hypothetical protein GOODEAATRI_028559 [Goodea atripinnis]|uniref:Uncharacterized protein n=1 Tax=Goodea atripinnis TaxID=208336 RepID=A0ABV0Q2K0_9TELE